ncbi:MAG: Holliday junction resolvase RuvX [Bacteroidetes bacterium]|nr:Holliday junction resolvase RuvX [Bacteroidota bacterium]
MGRILAIDYGQKRVGIAATDELQITSNGISTVHSSDIWQFLEVYLKENNVEAIVVGEPKDMRNQPSDASRFIEPFVKKLIKKYPQVKIERYDERFTSKMAFDAMIEGGLSKKKRRDKALVDKVSATLLLQSYLSSTEKRNS